MPEQSSERDSSDGSAESHNESNNNSAGSSENKNHNDSNDSDKSESQKEHSEEETEKKGECTLDGSVAIIHYENPETGEVEFYLEEKPTDYYIKKYRKKLSFIGGAIDTTDNGSLEALVRELTEEVGSREARMILIKSLYKSRRIYHKLVEDVDGKEAVTYIYSIKVDSKDEWDKVKNSYLTHDAGPAKVLKMKDILKMGEDSFAFGMCGILQNFIRQEYGKYVSSGNSSKYGASKYADIERLVYAEYTELSPNYAFMII